MTPRLTCHRLPSCLAPLLGLMLGLIWTAAVHAADHGATATALQVLTRPLGQEAADALPKPPVREQHVVQRSESVDMLIRRHYAGWPLKDEVFRHALHELNPGAIPNAANNLLKRGSTLVMPTAEDLRRTLLQHYPKAGDLVRIRVEVEAEDKARKSGSADAAGQDKRRWVRFP